MSVRCLGCGVVTARPRKGRCPVCYQASQRKYGHGHQLRRRQWAPLVAAGTVKCSRCNELIKPGEQWDLDHRPWGSEPSHANHNRGASGKP